MTTGIKRRDHKQRIYISYDSSNKNCNAGDIDLIEYGKAKDNKGIPIFNLAIAFDKTNRVPLFYEEYPGSITDVSQFVHMVDKVTEYGYKKVGFILDRGYFSKDNIRYMEEGGYAFVIMVKGRKALVSSLVEENRGTFETERDHSIRAYHVYGKTVKARLYEDDTRRTDTSISTSILPNMRLKGNAWSLRWTDLRYIWTSTSEMWLPHQRHVQEYFTLKYDKAGHLVGYSERKDVIKRELDLCGYFCIVTSEEMTASPDGYPLQRQRCFWKSSSARTNPLSGPKA
ncbi:MAG: transposase [Lacrimispora saccharolytica]